MRTRLITLCTVAFFTTAAHFSLLAQFEKVYPGPDHLAHVVARTGDDRAIPKEAEQVAIGTPALSQDRSFAGWTVEEENCCTSYSIPLSVVISSSISRRIVRVGNGLMIYDWCFVPGKAKVAISSGTVHGWTSGQNLHLYSASSGKLIASWSRPDGVTKPVWGRCLKP